MDPEVIALVILGFAGGLLNGFIGSGAGVVIVPVMVIMGYSNVDHASSLAVAISCWAALLHVIPHYIRTWRDKEWIGGIALFLGGAATAQFGVAFTQKRRPLHHPSNFVFFGISLSGHHESLRASTRERKIIRPYIR